MVAHIAKPVEPERVYDALAKWARAPLGAAVPQSRAGIDWPSLVARVGGDRALAESLVAQMRGEHSGDVGTVRSLISKGDFAGAVRIAHTLRGTAASVSALDVARLAGLLESQLLSDPANATGVLDELEGALKLAFDIPGVPPSK
jgi:HPt (histidine-containing phosphotransfer) domain-containing protein